MSSHEPSLCTRGPDITAPSMFYRPSVLRLSFVALAVLAAACPDPGNEPELDSGQNPVTGDSGPGDAGGDGEGDGDGAGDGDDAGMLDGGGTDAGDAMTGDTVCGDGFRQGMEECDDENREPNDGCDGTCKVEDGWIC